MRPEKSPLFWGGASDGEREDRAGTSLPEAAYAPPIAARAIVGDGFESQRRRKRRPGRTFPFVRRARRRRSQTDGGCPLLPTVTNAFFCVTGGRCATPPVRPGPVNDGRCSGGVFSDRVGRSSRPTYDHIKVGRGQQKAATDATKQND